MLSSINRHPTHRQLRQFAVTGLVLLPTVTAISTRSVYATVAALIIGAVLTTGSVVRPNLLRPVFIAVSVVTWPIGVVVSELVLLALYFLVFTPAGLVSRLAGRDPLRLRHAKVDTTNWQPSSAPRDADSYFRMS